MTPEPSLPPPRRQCQSINAQTIKWLEGQTKLSTFV
uniref:Uncharacterized protein n=1 Tax=Zea mays TaxID=4577 RepID=C0PMR8_MAIZE|nr:unknown [Zea mays]